MKKFKDFIKKLPVSNDAYVPDEPIHFKMGKVSTTPTALPKITSKYSGDAYVPDEPIHFKHVSKSSNLKEEKEHKDVHGWVNHNQNKHLGDRAQDISNKLTDHLHKNHPLNTKELHHTKEYTSSSSDVNFALIHAHKNKKDIEPYYHQSIHHLDSATSRPIGHHLHLYSGLGFNPDHMKNKNGHVHLPAYTSMTHDKSRAREFALDKAYKHEDGSKHILHIHMKKTDKGLHVSHFSHYHDEHETILPRNTKIKIHKKPTIYNDYGSKTHVWHAHIIHQD
jgi:hypothetical protein